jgi:hypothetical protein
MRRLLVQRFLRRAILPALLVATSLLGGCAVYPYGYGGYGYGYGYGYARAPVVVAAPVYRPYRYW